MAAENFKFFALHCLNDWCADDSRFVAGLSPDKERTERLKSIHEAAKYYKVTRTLRTVQDEVRLDAALTALDAVSPGITEESVDAAVRDLAINLRKSYQTYPISAASKFLWLRHMARL